MAIFWNEGLDFNSDEPGIPIRELESILLTKSAEREVKATILILLFLLKSSFE